MTVCTRRQSLFSSCKTRKIEVDQKGVAVTSDAGALLLRQADRRIGLTRAVAAFLHDKRQQKKVRHSYHAQLLQRVYGIALGYEDLNDHDTLRHDPCIQTAVDRDDTLAGRSTLCRFEQLADRETCRLVHEIFMEIFLQSHPTPPKELILDFDATDDLVHGEQEGRNYSGYYRNYCFLPLYVFCGQQLLVSYLRPSDEDAALHTGAILKLLVGALRKAWPDVRILFRADSGFCRHHVFEWCERNGVEYITGIGENSVLRKRAKLWEDKSELEHLKTGEKSTHFGEFQYAAGAWRKERRIIAKAEHSSLGQNLRCVVTNLEGDPEDLYKNTYCGRGDMENRIKEQKLGLFSDRTSCSKWWSNQFRLLLSSMAFILVETIRRLGLADTKLATAQVGTIREKLFKVGAVVVRNTRRVRLHLSSFYPNADLFMLVARRLAME